MRQLSRFLLLCFAMPHRRSDPSVLGSDEFLALVSTFERSALRLESRSHTDIADERAEFTAFLRDDLPYRRVSLPPAWTEIATRQAAAGRPIRRVRVMDHPLTDYNRYMIYTGRLNVRFGEDIRYLSRERANSLDLPDHDFWVFDSRCVVDLRFTADGRVVGRDLITHPAIVAEHESWIRCGLAAATPSVDYVSEDPTRAWPPIRVGAMRGG